MPEAMWYCEKNGERVGPFGLIQLRQMAAAGDLARDGLVCPEGGSEWASATTVPGLFDAPPASPPAGGIVPCMKCGKRISDEATTCPLCGERQPKQDQLDGKCDGGRCEKCETFNTLGMACIFPVGPRWTCRGCGVPLTEAYPTAHILSEMEGIHLRWLEARVFWGWAVAVTCFVAQQMLFPFQGGWVVGLLCAVTGYHLASFVTKQLWRVRALSPLRDRIRAYTTANPYSWWGLDAYDSPERLRCRSVRDWSSNGHFVYLTHAAHPRTAVPDARRTNPGHQSWWPGIAMSVALVVGGVYVYRTEFSQYALGRKAGVHHVRELSAKGAFIRAGMNVANLLDLIPANPDASADWNAGFRAGFREELGRMYPDAGR